jgi:hypothetical protein
MRFWLNRCRLVFESAVALSVTFGYNTRAQTARKELMKQLGVATVCICIAGSFIVSTATAQFVFLSADVNIANPLDGSAGLSGIDGGNQRFFENILQGGSKVAIHGDFDGDGTAGDIIPAIDGFYNGLDGVTSSIAYGTVSDAMLSGVDLFVAMLPDNAYTVDEISSISAFLSDGGSMLALGDNDAFSAQNARINLLLSALGTGMSIVAANVDGGSFHVASGEQIVVDPFTAGIDTFSYAATSKIGYTASIKNLFFDSQGEPFVSYKLIPMGDFNSDGVVDSADYVVWRHQLGDLVASGSGADANGNGVVDNEDIQVWRKHFGKVIPGFVAATSSATSPTPEPSALSLAVIAAFAAITTRRRYRYVA